MEPIEEEIYMEELRFLVLPRGRQVLIPELEDVAAQRARVADLEDALSGVYDPEQVRDDVREARESLDALEGEELAGARAKVDSWDRECASRWLFLRERLRQEKFALEQMEAIGDDPLEGAQIRIELYGMRELAYDEAMRVEAKHTTVNESTGQRTIDQPARDLELLHRVLVCRVVDGEKREAGDPASYKGLRTPTLIARMWARNSLTPAVARFFLGRRGAPGGSG